MSNKVLFYFGPMRQAGHYLWENDHSQIYERNAATLMKGANGAILGNIDGNFTPGSTTQQGLYLESIIPPMRIVGWWDYTQDKRGGSNSNLIGYGYESAEEMIDDAFVKFPTVMNRQPRPVKLEA